MTLGYNDFFDELLSVEGDLLIASKEAKNEQHLLRKQLMQIETNIQSQISNLRNARENIKQAIYKDIETMSEEKDGLQSRLDKIQNNNQAQDNRIIDIGKAKQTILDFPALWSLWATRESCNSSAAYLKPRSQRTKRHTSSSKGVTWK